MNILKWFGRIRFNWIDVTGLILLYDLIRDGHMWIGCVLFFAFALISEGLKNYLTSKNKL